MATTEHTGLMTYIDENGNHHILYPVTNIDAVDGLPQELNTKLSMELAWQNASPTSDFEAQSISFQLNSGDVLFIRTMSWGQYRDFNIVVVEDERKLFLLGDFRATAENRLCAISKTGIDFGDVANDTHKNVIVPTQIYRFKGGSA